MPLLLSAAGPLVFCVSCCLQSLEQERFTFTLVLQSGQHSDLSGGLSWLFDSVGPSATFALMLF